MTIIIDIFTIQDAIRSMAKQVTCVRICDGTLVIGPLSVHGYTVVNASRAPMNSKDIVERIPAKNVMQS